VRFAVVLADGGYQPAHDAFDYDRHGLSIAAGEGFPESNSVPDGGPTALRAPAYPYLLGAIYALSGDSLTAGRLAGAALGAIAVLLVYLIARAVWGRRVALVAAGIAAVFPPLVLLSRELLSESLFLVLELGAVLCALACRRSGGALRWAAAAGALCGLAALTRNPGAVLVIPVAIGVWTLRPRLRADALVAPALVVLCAALVIVPWTLRNAVEFGRFIPVTTSTGFALAGTYNEVSWRDDATPAAWRTPVIVPEYAVLFQTPGVDEGTLDATLRREATEFAWEHPAYVAEAAGWNGLRLFELVGGAVVGERGEPVEHRGIGSDSPVAQLAGLVIAAGLALVGIWAIARSRSRGGLGRSTRLPRGPWFLWLVPILMIVAALPVAGVPRYRAPADPFLLILAAIGVVWAWDRFAVSRARPAAGSIIPVAVAGALALLALGGCGGGDSDEPASTRPEGETSGSTKERYIAQVNAICRDALRETRRLGRRFATSGAGSASDVLELTTEGLIGPGIEIRERQAERLRRVERPVDLSEPDAEALDVYLDLFGPIGELSRQRLRAGRAADLEEARRLEALMLELANEQRQAADRFGLRACDADFVGEAFRQAPSG
jgi:4-amino-4-deoxy-L-arabinose transferase-like glycosyltransferase